MIARGQYRGENVKIWPVGKDSTCKTDEGACGACVILHYTNRRLNDTDLEGRLANRESLN